MSANMSSWDNRDELYHPVDQASYHQDIRDDQFEDTNENRVSSSHMDDEGQMEPDSAGRDRGRGSRPHFRVRLDVRQFEPHEVHVQHDGDYVQVTGRHEERHPQHGFISREFRRRYELPSDVDPDNLTCSWHPDHVLIIKGARDSMPIEDIGYEDEFIPLAESSA